jgi:hypothetical protein
MIFLYALLQSPIIPPTPPQEDAKPFVLTPSPEELARGRTFDYDLPDLIHEFVGRRHLCAEGEEDHGPEAEDRRRFLRCATIHREEVELRRLYAGDVVAESALNQHWRDYRNERFLARFGDDKPKILVRRSIQEALHVESGKKMSVVMETSANQSPTIRITARWGDVAARTIQIPVSDLPDFDMSTVSLFLRPSGEHEGLGITVSFGRHRGYCWRNQDDDRPEVSFWFTRRDVSASKQGWPNCESSHETLPVELAPAR